MTFNLKLVQDFSLQERALHELAKACWGNYSMPIVDRKGAARRKILSEFADSSHIRRHREAVLSKVSEMCSSTLPKTLSDKLKIAVIRLQRGYREALACTEPYQDTQGLFMPNPLMAGPYSAKYFIDPSGHFDDLAWAKRFISDDEISVYSRFELACFFCFEETIRELWSSVKNKGSSRYEGRLYNIREIYGFPVIFWIYQLENKLDELLNEFAYITDPSDAFYLVGVRQAVDQSHEHAARFFWARCTDREKAEYLEDITRNQLTVGCSTRNPRILNFVYSLLPLAPKGHLFSLVCYRLFVVILKNLSEEMVEIPLSGYEDIFLDFWKHLNQVGIRYINEFTPAIRNLIVIKAEPLLSKIIQPLRHDDKLFLLGDTRFWIVGEYLWHGNNDLLLRFLMFFMIDLDTVTQTLSLKGESITDLCHHLETRFLRETEELELSSLLARSAKLEIRKVVENIRESFEVLDDLLSQLGENPET